jgi:hypothetical protein
MEQQREPLSYARIALLRPHDGATADFEAGNSRHLEWHRQANDPWSWYGWTIWAGERQRWFVYATFGHAAADFDASVAPGTGWLPLAKCRATFGCGRVPVLRRSSKGRPTQHCPIVSSHWSPGPRLKFSTCVGRCRTGWHPINGTDRTHTFINGSRLPLALALHSLCAPHRAICVNGHLTEGSS